MAITLSRGAKVKLGRWDEYLAMRQGVLALNEKYRDLLSNDLGAIAGVLFDIGSGRYAPPPRDGDAEAALRWEADIQKIREEAGQANKALQATREQDRTHTEVQGWLRDLGMSLGFSVWIASNDWNRSYSGGRLAMAASRHFLRHWRMCRLPNPSVLSMFSGWSLIAPR